MEDVLRFGGKWDRLHLTFSFSLYSILEETMEFWQNGVTSRKQGLLGIFTKFPYFSSLEPKWGVRMRQKNSRNASRFVGVSPVSKGLEFLVGSVSLDARGPCSIANQTELTLIGFLFVWSFKRLILLLFLSPYVPRYSTLLFRTYLLFLLSLLSPKPEWR